ncbi:hypothetical protein, partial [Bacillus cereus]|uniref:hypothetical protein n=1 Tax=Bacillus cereus TaxID=1396 RepID=UPI0020BDCCE4
MIGLDEHHIKKILQKYEFGQIDIANYNTSSQIVIAGAAEEIKRAASFFEKEGAKAYIVLQVGGAFHSRFMESA